MSNSNDHANNYDSEIEPPSLHNKDSTKKQHEEDDDVDIVEEDVIIVQSREAERIDNSNSKSEAEAEVEDEASDVQSLLTSVPPPSSSSSPPRPTHHHRESAPPHTPPPPLPHHHHPMPFGTFVMPAGIVPPPMFMPQPPPPPPHFQFFPYGQPYMPYGYTQIPNNYNYPPNPWVTGPFDCFSDAKNCCLTCCCPCVTFGQITEILNEGQTPWWEHAAGYLVLESITLSVGTFLYAWPYRVKMRTKFWLRGKLLWDLIFTFFCTRVSLCQQYRQLCRLGLDVPLGWEANREKMRVKALENIYRMHNRQVTPPVIELGMYR